MACIAGGIAQAFFAGVAAEFSAGVRRYLPEEFLGIVDEFNAAYRL